MLAVTIPLSIISSVQLIVPTVKPFMAPPKNKFPI